MAFGDIRIWRMASTFSAAFLGVITFVFFGDLGRYQYSVRCVLAVNCMLIGLLALRVIDRGVGGAQVAVLIPAQPGTWYYTSLRASIIISARIIHSLVNFMTHPIAARATYGGSVVWCVIAVLFLHFSVESVPEKKINHIYNNIDRMYNLSGLDESDMNHFDVVADLGLTCDTFEVQYSSEVRIFKVNGSNTMVTTFTKNIDIRSMSLVNAENIWLGAQFLCDKRFYVINLSFGKKTKFGTFGRRRLLSNPNPKQFGQMRMVRIWLGILLCFWCMVLAAITWSDIKKQMEVVFLSLANLFHG